jgi:hypothetical protein
LSSFYYKLLSVKSIDSCLQHSVLAFDVPESCLGMSCHAKGVLSKFCDSCPFTLAFPVVNQIFAIDRSMETTARRLALRSRGQWEMTWRLHLRSLCLGLRFCCFVFGGCNFGSQFERSSPCI